jgi:hypothetical protein
MMALNLDFELLRQFQKWIILRWNCSFHDAPHAPV